MRIEKYLLFAPLVVISACAGESANLSKNGEFIKENVDSNYTQSYESDKAACLAVASEVSSSVQHCREVKPKDCNTYADANLKSLCLYSNGLTATYCQTDNRMNISTEEVQNACINARGWRDKWIVSQ